MQKLDIVFLQKNEVIVHINKGGNSFADRWSYNTA